MSIIHTGLFSIMERFPDYKETIKKLYKESHAFQTLCADYRTCIDAHQHWRHSESEEGILRREEYAALLKDLEAEILESLNEASWFFW